MAYPDLTTLANVREHLTIAAAQTGKDTLISNLISRASLAIMDYTEREFITDPALTTTRKFVYYGGGRLNLAPYDLQSVSTITIDTDGTSPADTALTADQYRLFPRQPRHGVYTSIELRGLGPGVRDSSVDYTPTRELEIAGTWGFASIPEDVEEACILMVAHLYRHFAQAYSTSGIGDELDLAAEGRREMPFAAKEILRRYRRGIT